MPATLEHKKPPPPGDADAVVLELARAIARMLARTHDAAERAGRGFAEPHESTEG
jgi:hypothetical protein